MFALHPMRVETVAWISEIKGLLFTFFSLISFLLYIKYLTNNYKIKFYILALLMAVFASLSKIQGLMIPFSLILFDIYYKRKLNSKSIIEKLLLIFIFISLFFLPYKYQLINVVIIISAIYFIQKQEISKKTFLNFAHKKYLKTVIIGIIVLASLILLILYFPVNKLALWYESRYTYTIVERFMLAGFALWFYISNFFSPFNLNAIHPYPTRLPNGLLPNEYYITIIVLIITIFISTFLILKRRKISSLLFFGWFFFLINISIVLHFVPIQGRVIVADRYSYLAYLGLSLVIGSLGEKYLFNQPKLKKPLLLCFMFLLLFFSYYTYNRCNVWINTSELFGDVIKKHPKISFAYSNLGAEYMNKEKYDSALICYDKAIEIDSLDSYAYFNRAFTFIEKGNNQKAIDDFKSAISINSNYKFRALSYTHIGDIYNKIGQDSLAIYYFDLAIKTNSESSFSFNKRGVYYLNRNMSERAQSDFRKAVELDAYYAEAINNLGSVFLSSGNVNEALKCFDQAIEVEPEYSVAYFNRGFLKYNNNKPSEAIIDFNIAIKLNKEFYPAYIQRGRVNAYLRNYENAIADFSYVLEKEPNNLLALTNRAYALFYINKIVNAEKDFIKATEINPGTPFVWQNLGWLYMKLNDTKRALNAYKKSLEIDSTLTISLINIGCIYTTLKEYNKAEEYLLNSLNFSPNNSESQFFLGELFRFKGDKETSCKYYEKAADQGNIDAKNAKNKYCI